MKGRKAGRKKKKEKKRPLLINQSRPAPEKQRSHLIQLGSIL
jgi:hypothetical protein